MIESSKPSTDSRCVRDTDNDGNCHLCIHRGGCKAIGGPFIRCIDCNEVKPSSEMMVRQPYCRTCLPESARRSWG